MEGRPRYFLGGLNLFFLFFHLFPSLSLSLPLFPSFYLFFNSFYLFFTLFPFFYFFFYLFPSFSCFFSFFALFHIFFISPPFSHYFFFFLFSLSFSHCFSHFRWPGRGRSLAALPCLPLPYLTLHLLSSPLFPKHLFLKKKEASRFSADFCAE